MRAKERTLQTHDDDPMGAVPASMVTIHAFADIDLVTRDLFRQLVESRQVRVSADGRTVAEVVRMPGGYAVRHPAVSVSHRFESALLVDVSAAGARVYASRGMQRGVFDLAGENVTFVAPLDECVGIIRSGDGSLVHGIQAKPAPVRRRFIRPSGDVHDETVEYDREARTWRPQETQINPLPDGRVLCMRHGADGWERVLYGDGAIDRVRMTYAPSVRSFPLGDAFLDLRGYGSTYGFQYGPHNGIRSGTVEFAWAAPDASSVVILEGFSAQHDAFAKARGPKRRLVRLYRTGDWDVLQTFGRFSMGPNDLWWSSSGLSCAARICRVTGGGDAHDEIVAPSGPPMALFDGSRVRECLVRDDATVAAFRMDHAGGTCVQVGDERFGPFLYAWNMSLENGHVAFNAVEGTRICRVIAR